MTYFRKWFERNILEKEKKHENVRIDIEEFALEKQPLKSLSNLLFFPPNTLVSCCVSSDSVTGAINVWNITTGELVCNLGTSKHSRIIKWDDNSVLAIARGTVDHFRVIEPFRRIEENDLNCLKDSHVYFLLKGGRDVLVAITEEYVEVVSFSEDRILKKLRIQVKSSDCLPSCYCKRWLYMKYMRFSNLSRALMSRTHPNVMYLISGNDMYLLSGRIKMYNIETEKAIHDITLYHSYTVNEINLLYNDGVEFLIVTDLNNQSNFFNTNTGSCRRVLDLSYQTLIQYIGSGYLFCHDKRLYKENLMVHYLGGEYRRVSPYCRSRSNVILCDSERFKGGVTKIVVIEEDIKKKEVRFAYCSDKMIKFARIKGLEDLTGGEFFDGNYVSGVLDVEDLKERVVFLNQSIDELIFLEKDVKFVSFLIRLSNVQVKVQKVFLLL